MNDMSRPNMNSSIQAIGHAINKSGIETYVDYNGEHDFSYARCSAYMAAKLLQNSGIVKMVHDGSAAYGS